jgi:hypothetical protein
MVTFQSVRTSRGDARLAPLLAKLKTKTTSNQRNLIMMMVPKVISKEWTKNDEILRRQTDFISV